MAEKYFGQAAPRSWMAEKYFGQARPRSWMAEKYFGQAQRERERCKLSSNERCRRPMGVHGKVCLPELGGG
jgi:hypothetical protein